MINLLDQTICNPIEGGNDHYCATLRMPNPFDYSIDILDG